MSNPYDLREIFESMEYDLIKSLKRNFERHRLEEIAEGFEWEMWQVSKLRNLEKFRQANRDIIGKYAPETEKIIHETLSQSFSAGEKKVVKAIENLDEFTAEFLFPQGKNHGATRTPENIFFGMNDKRLEALIQSVTNDFKKAENAVLRKMDDAYRQVIYKAEMNMSAGVKTLSQAIDMATIDFLEQGLNVIEYKNGRRVNIASYAEMSLRTASQRATFLGEGKKRDEYGIHLIVISAHANTCDKCMPWQGKVLIDDVYSSGTKADGSYPLLSTAMEAGLFHPNCRHTPTTYFPGISRLPNVPDEELGRRNYQAEQKQRYIERNIRKYKRLEAGSLDLNNQAKYHEKVKEWQGKMREHLEANPQLRRDYSRERPGHGISNKDLKVNREILKQKAIGDKIKESRNKIRNGEYNLKVREQKQQEHIVGTKQWQDYFKRKIESNSNNRPTMFNRDVNIQELINEYKGKGTIEFSRSKDSYPREYIDTDKVLGKYWDDVEMRYKDANRFEIVYSSKGVHAFPIRPLKKGE